MTKKKRTDFITPQRQRMQHFAATIGEHRAPFATYMAVAAEADHRDGIAYCSARSLADWWGWNRNGVREDLTTLAKAGLIRWEKGTGRRNPGRIEVLHYFELMGGNVSRSTGTPTGTPTGTDSGRYNDAPQLLTVDLRGGQDFKTLSFSRSLSRYPGNGEKAAAIPGVLEKDKEPSSKESNPFVELPDVKEVAR